jgi:hypothetical protein
LVIKCGGFKSITFGMETGSGEGCVEEGLQRADIWDRPKRWWRVMGCLRLVVVQL